MAEITLARVDFRLIHGQVAVKWSKVAHATKIVVVDDFSAGNDMLKGVLKAAAPTGVKVLVFSVEKCVAKWNEKQFGEGKVMIVFKDIPTCYRAFKAGYPLPALQLGNVPNAAGRKPLGNEVFANDKELEMLREMAAAGTKIEIQTIPDNVAVPFEKAAAKL